MQSIKSSILRRLRISISTQTLSGNPIHPNIIYLRQLCTGAAAQCSSAESLTRVIGLVNKFDGIDAAKVTEKDDFHKDLNLDSLDRVELVMALEQEFSLEIPDEITEKHACCADFASYIVSESKEKSF